MITLLADKTSISKIGATPALTLVWKLDFRAGFTVVKVHLDPCMYGTPPEFSSHRSTTFTYGSPAISVSHPDSFLSENRKTVTFGVAALSVTNTSGSLQKKTIPFEWRNPRALPKKVEILVVTESLVGSRRYHLVGFNVDEGVIDFVTHRNSSSFHFPFDARHWHVPYWEFSRDAALYQDGFNTTVRSVTWPMELKYWYSGDGERYLTSVVRHK